MFIYEYNSINYMEVYIMSKQTKVELTKVLVVIETIIAFVITMLINQTIAIALFVMMTIVVCVMGNNNINESESKEEEI